MILGSKHNQHKEVQQYSLTGLSAYMLKDSDHGTLFTVTPHVFSLSAYLEIYIYLFMAENLSLAGCSYHPSPNIDFTGQMANPANF